MCIDKVFYKTFLYEILSEIHGRGVMRNVYYKTFSLYETKKDSSRVPKGRPFLSLVKHVF